MTNVIRFAETHIASIQDKTKRLTIRYNFNKPVRVGDTVRFMDSDNLLFGEAVVLAKYTMTAGEVVGTEWNYHENYTDINEFREVFNRYYPHVEFTEETELDVLEWNDTFMVNRIYNQNDA